MIPIIQIVSVLFVAIAIRYFVRSFTMESTTIQNGKQERDELKDKIIVITGANAGLGKEIATIMARKGAHIIMACRTERKAIEAVKEIKSISGNDNVEYMLLDLLSMESIAQFARQYRERKIKCDMLINNAGIMWLKEDLVNQPPLTKINQETGLLVNTQYQANYLGHHLLTLSLLDILIESGCSVLNVSSSVHSLARSLDLANITANNSYTFITYCQSKLCQILSSYDLQQRLDQYYQRQQERDDSNPAPAKCTINTVHPGIFASDIVNLPFPLRNLYHAIFKSAAYCAKYVAKVVIDTNLNQGTGGLYFDHGKAVKSSGVSYNPELASSLYTKSLDIIRPYLGTLKNPLTPNGTW